MFILDKDSGESKSIEINKYKKRKKKILTVAFMLLFNYPDTIPKQYANEVHIKHVTSLRCVLLDALQHMNFAAKGERIYIVILILYYCCSVQHDSHLACSNGKQSCPG